MAHDISRRDFLDGVALAIAAGLAPATQARAAAGAAARDPPALGGLRGHHAGSFEVAHALREGHSVDLAGVAVSERYDLVVVGAGISGLAAAWFWRREAGRRQKILVIDNHDDFGGHAKRNELRVGDRLILGYGGSESLQSPHTMFSPAAMGLVTALGIDLDRFKTTFDRRFYPSRGLSRGVFFPREKFGRDVLVAGDPTMTVADDLGPGLLNAKSVRDFVAGFPISEPSRAQLVALYEQAVDPLAGKSRAEKRAILAATSYRDWLIRICGCSEEAANCFQGRTLDYFALGCDAVSADDARKAGYPGFAKLGLGRSGAADAEPYIHHFPDGNASLARLLVRSLVPAAIPGRSMDDIVLAPVDYTALDRDGSLVRIRLDSTCVHVRNAGAGVDIAYVRDGRTERVAAANVVLACFSAMVPHLMPELPAAQRLALAAGVRAPLVYTKVAVRDWRPWVALGVHEIAAPMSFHCRVKLDYPVSMGGYGFSRGPDEPIGLHLVHVPGAPNSGLDAREQFRIGRATLLDATFADFEERIRDELDRMLGPGGFSCGRDIAGITVNRWSHGYAYTASTLFDKGHRALLARARKPAGRVAIANSDAGGDAYAHTAIDQAARAVRELIG
ncbi:FAD/NAD(P)-binding protein [Rhodoplanes sp.]|uniref:NAD(P)-binding protein n=1 Tax=Rhodoplanes sp. TaxID=1968906 RepID=UPI0025D7D514|nr:FAD/NAD(P)-binding protein [Rhodoplanes sp.]